MTVQEMCEQKKKLGYSYEKIAELSGLPIGTVQKVLGGITKSPRYDTLAALEKAFRPAEGLPADMVKEEAFAYYGEKRQGMYTLRDYYNLPKERRAELIDGVFYDMSAPSSIHQVVSGEIYDMLRSYIRSRRGQCVAAYAPLDVQLDRNDRTMVQPDVMVVCDRSKFQRGIVYGAPDFIVEILSKATKKKDSFLKLSKYANAGVREYWIVDPEKRSVVVYDLEHDNWPVVYGFDHSIPVTIFGGECKIDFTEISQYIQFLYGQDETP